MFHDSGGIESIGNSRPVGAILNLPSESPHRDSDWIFRSGVSDLEILDPCHRVELLRGSDTWAACRRAS